MPALDQPPAIVCSIVREEIGGQLQLRGRLRGEEETQGLYSLRIVKTGPSGSATINQAGPFSAAAHVELLVGFASFNLEPGARYSAEFTIQIGDQTYTCGPQP